MSSVQHRLSDYLQYEMHHILGAYGVAERKLEELEQRIRDTVPVSAVASEEKNDAEDSALLQLARRAREYNAALGATRDSTSADERHPIPTDLPLSLAERFDIRRDRSEVEAVRRGPWKDPTEWSWVLNFYDAAIYVLSPEPRDHEGKVDPKIAQKLAQNLVCRRDGLASGARNDEAQARQQRLKRYRLRRDEAYTHLRGPQPEDADKRLPSVDFIHRITTDNLSMDSEGSLPFFIVKAQAEAHLAMHAVEAWRSMPLGQYASRVAGERKWLEKELDRCIALNTFVYCVSRSAPWIFAEDATERRRVFENFSECWQHVVPTRCMWLAGQVSLLALHRRAYARALRDDSSGAYNDYHKLQRQIRDTRRRIQSAPIHVEGAQAFLVGLDSQAHHHIGELYRAKHAHQPAVKHFRSASHGLEHLSKDDEMKEVLTNSRWYVQLQVSQAKARYELGHHKESLCWQLRGWRQLLQLLADDTGTVANTAEIDKAIDWLTEVRFEPELLKSEIEEYVGPVIEQMDGISVADHLGALAGDILLRIGHLLFVLNIGRAAVPPKLPKRKAKPGEEDAERMRIARKQIARSLAFKCLVKAADCDRRNTLVGADMLKARFRFRSWLDEWSEEYDELLMPHELAPISEHWPGGGTDYEHLVRVTEYLMLRAQMHVSASDRFIGDPEAPGTEEDYQDAQIASDLLLSFFMHTDSINVRKSQVHEFLMRNRAKRDLPDGASRPAIEFISMRRYSSSFTLLPRPSAFRALGGGYFIRLHNTFSGQRDDEAVSTAPFGIVVDPGVDFIENLYRTGYSLSDIDMIIVTHDHVDHLGSFDPLLSLLHEHSQVREREWTPDSGRMGDLVIYASKSVEDRYRRIGRLWKGTDFRSLEGLVEQAGPRDEVSGWPEGFEIWAMSSAEHSGAKVKVRDRGHPDNGKNPAHGICINFQGGDGSERGASVAITSDTPPPPPSDKDHYDSWRKAWRRALEADLLVCHLSTVPVTELRKLAHLAAEFQPMRDDDRDRIEVAAGRLADKVRAARAAIEAEKSALEGLLGEKLELKKRQVTRAELKWLGQREQTIEKIEAESGALIHLVREREVLHPDVTEREERIREVVNEFRGYLEEPERPPDLPNDLFALVPEADRLLATIGGLPDDVEELRDVRRELQAAAPRLKGQTEFALWLRSHEKGGTARLLTTMPPNWQPPAQHSYLTGVVRWAREYREARRPWGNGLLSVGELSEELGTVRIKVAVELNQKVFAPERPGTGRAFNAITSDIGLQVAVGPPVRGRSALARRSPARVLCTICSLDNDRVPGERFHDARDIHEVCVKGENEGVFYNCTEHNPSTQEDPAFLEQLERFDIFGR